ncbi:MAG TPA: NB-ARC domain-containing protein [Kiritimatiellia bacterium]|nr:NB-ARC domain-containing protein [Kiritimatiellia bacterium]
MKRIFISYARGDDEPFVRRLQADLVKAGFRVWFDRESLLSRGLTFHQEIRDAIRTEVDRVVYIGGPQAAVSTYVREEWQTALAFDHVTVTPILRLGDYDGIPGELRLLHCEDFRSDASYPSAVARLVESLRAPNPRMGALHAVPELPIHFLDRPELMARMRAALLVDLQTPNVRKRGETYVGVQGMGGIGKSVLAGALARDRLVRQAYPDGVFWVCCGPHMTQDDALHRQRELVRMLGGRDDFVTVREGLVRLGARLAERAALLVLDDVWTVGDVAAFDALGPRCRTLITTRDAGVLHTLRGETVPVSLFREEDALRLLADAVGRSPSELPPGSIEVARACGCLPLALALCGGMARKQGGDFRWVLERLRRAELDKIADRQSLQEQHRNLWRAMQASVDVLPELELARFRELSVFDPQRPVPAAAASTLWAHTGSMSDMDAEDLLTSLAERSLVQRDVPDPSAGPRPFSLHPLVYEYARRVAGDERVLHQKLLEAYRRKAGGTWDAIVDDGYVRAFLPSHLVGAEAWDELLRIIDAPFFGCLHRWVEQGETAMGVDCLAPLVDHLLTSGRARGRAAALACQLARVHTQRGEPAESERRLRQALAHARWWRDGRTRAIAHHELGSLALYVGDRAKAGRCYRRALWWARCLGPAHLDEVAANRLALATLNLEEYDYESAIAQARAALPLASRMGDAAHVVAAHRLLASAFKDLMRADEAMRHLDEAAAVARTADRPVELLHVHLALGWLRYTEAVLAGHSFDSAAGIFRKLMKEAGAMEQLYVELEAALGLVWTLLADGDRDAAARALEGIQESRASAHKELASMLTLGRAKLHQECGVGDAGRFYLEVLEWARAAGKRGMESDALVALGAARWHGGDRGGAESLWAEARAAAARCAPVRRSLVDLSIEAARRDAHFSPR